MDVGRMAVIQDPQGAFFEIWEPNLHIGASLVNAPGALSWNELASPDMDASSKFYTELFGWKVTPMEGTGMPYSTLHNAADHANGGIRPAMPPGTPPHWLVYLGTHDIDAARSKVEELGGKMLSDTIDIGPGQFAPVQDPQGAIFALYAGHFDD
jgi:hypothetical protein